MISSTVPSAKYSCSGSPLMFWNSNTAIDGLSGSGSGWGGVEAGFSGDGPIPNSIHTHWPRDVLNAVLAQVLKRVVEPVAHLIANDTADANPAGLSQSLQPGRHIHAITEDVVHLDDYVPEVDADAKLDPSLSRRARVALGHSPLHLDRAPDGIHHARELGKEA